MEKLKILMEAVLNTIQENTDEPGTVIVGGTVLLGLMIMYWNKLNKKAKKIKRFTKKFK